MKIIGIGGTTGSGKDTLAEMLAQRHGWLFVSVTDILRDEAHKRGMSLERRNLRQISAEWRRAHGPAVSIDKAVQKFNTQKQDHPGLVIASLRHPAEADRVQKLRGKVVWVDTDPPVRYERITSRKRGSEDEVTFEEFQAEEQAQMQHHEGDEATLNLGEVKAKADIFLENNGSDIAAFKNEAEAAFKAAKLLA